VYGKVLEKVTLVILDGNVPSRDAAVSALILTILIPDG
jgi:hypothetical protein